MPKYCVQATARISSCKVPTWRLERDSNPQPFRPVVEVPNQVQAIYNFHVHEVKVKYVHVIQVYTAIHTHHSGIPFRAIGYRRNWSSWRKLQKLKQQQQQIKQHQWPVQHFNKSRAWSMHSCTCRTRYAMPCMAPSVTSDTETDT